MTNSVKYYWIDTTGGKRYNTKGSHTQSVQPWFPKVAKTINGGEELF